MSDGFLPTTDEWEATQKEMAKLREENAALKTRLAEAEMALSCLAMLCKEKFDDDEPELREAIAYFAKWNADV